MHRKKSFEKIILFGDYFQLNKKCRNLKLNTITQDINFKTLSEKRKKTCNEPGFSLILFVNFFSSVIIVQRHINFWKFFTKKQSFKKRVFTYKPLNGSPKFEKTLWISLTHYKHNQRLSPETVSSRVHFHINWCK